MRTALTCVALILLAVCATSAHGLPITATSLLDPLSWLADTPQLSWENRTTIDVASDGNQANARIVEQYCKLPLSFVENRGQLDSAVRYTIRGPQASAFFTDNGVTLDLSEPLPRDVQDEPRTRDQREISEKLTARAAVAHKCAVLRMQFEGADPNCRVEGIDELPGKANYLTGSDSSKWHTDTPTFKGVIYRGVWPGIDVSYHGDRRQLKYDIRVAPGADLSQIRLRYNGAENLWLDDSGYLHVQTAVTTFVEEVPGICQENGAAKQLLDGGYVLLDDHTVSFRVEDRDPDLPLVIDPASDLVYSTLLGGSYGDGTSFIAVDASGCAYVAGDTYSSDFPTTTGAYDRTYGGDDYNDDTFVTKLDATGSALAYSTFLGGSGDDWASSIAVDASGCAYVAGDTGSSDFPTTTGTFQRTLRGYSDAFVIKLRRSPGITLTLTPNTLLIGDPLTVTAEAPGASAVWLRCEGVANGFPDLAMTRSSPTTFSLSFPTDFLVFAPGSTVTFTAYGSAPDCITVSASARLRIRDPSEPPSGVLALKTDGSRTFDLADGTYETVVETAERLEATLLVNHYLNLWFGVNVSTSGGAEALGPGGGLVPE